MTANPEFHEAANIFPLDEVNLDSLAADIQEHGLIVPIELLDGKIIDGRRRWLACQKVGVEPQMRKVAAADPIAYVLSLNRHRRHLTASQLAMVAARARTIYDRQAKERQRGGQGGKLLPAKLPEAKSDARDAAGKAVGVSGKMVDYASKVLKEGTPALQKAVDEGRMALHTAVILTSEPADVQDQKANSPEHRRAYRPEKNGYLYVGEDSDEDDEEDKPKKNGRVGVGVIRANEAVNCLMRIPKNDPLRKRGFQIVADWIRHNS